MSQLLINDYLRQLDLIKKVSGSQRETIVREAFKDLLKTWGKQQGLTFLAEYPLKTATKTNISVDGALLHELRMPLGYWEAKDAADDLDQEIAKKQHKGYPQDNIIFSDDHTVVLWQHRQEVTRCTVEDTTALEKLLKLFFSYERPEIAGFRAAVEQFKADLPAVLQALREMIDTQERTNPAFRAASTKFLAHAQEAINPSLGEADVREMLIQHILTEEIFANVFNDSDFHQHNNVARELYALEAAFFTGALKKNTLKGLESYYAAIRATAAQIADHHEKQTFLKVIYENFYKVYNVKAADRLGVVYTPNEIVRFMIDGADWLCEQHFGRNLIDRDVDILDPATGTGTFICELLEHFRGQPKKLEHKYTTELHANEVAILPYYVANLNIEATYAAITGGYKEFENLCFVDTLDNVGLHTAARGTTAELFGSVSEENVKRIRRQNSRRISVVIGNPPYNANQANENDNNKNREYPAIDKRIKATYIAESTAQKTKLYDMYARFFRWASDRLADNGVLALVTNRSFIESRTFDGFRKTVAQEFSDIYIVDLGGDVRANPRLSGTKHNVFGIQTGVAISFMVKRAQTTKDKRPARVYYARRPELETAEEKLAFLASQPLRSVALDEVRPDKAGNWINLANNDFETLIPLLGTGKKTVFARYASAVKTNRDEWVYDISADHLIEKVAFLAGRFNAQLRRGLDDLAALDYSIKWSSSLRQRAEAVSVAKDLVVASTWRPFVRRWYYAEKLLSDRLTRNHFDFFSSSLSLQTSAIYLPGPPLSKPMHVLAIRGVADYHVAGDAVVAPVSVGTDENANNITDWALKQFTTHYASEIGKGKGARKIDKDAIFHYCYAVLHDPVYREKYALNLKREFPRIPFYAHFWQWADWGAELMRLHIDYEQVAPFALQRHDEPDEKARAAGLAPKALLRSDHAAGSITLDTETTLRGVPAEAWTYKLGNRCAIDWVLDQYKEKKPRDATIREKFDTYRFADYKEKVADLLARVTTVSVETQRIVAAMQRATR